MQKNAQYTNSKMIQFRQKSIQVRKPQRLQCNKILTGPVLGMDFEHAAIFVLEPECGEEIFVFIQKLPIRHNAVMIVGQM